MANVSIIFIYYKFMSVSIIDEIILDDILYTYISIFFII